MAGYLWWLAYYIFLQGIKLNMSSLQQKIFKKGGGRYFWIWKKE